MTQTTRLSRFLSVVLLIATVAAPGAALRASGPEAVGPLPPSGLKCEYLSGPRAVDTARPRFSWELRHNERGQVQSAYEVVISTGVSADTAVVWDSGRVASADSTQVLYAGPALRSDTAYSWKVRSWDGQGRESGWSAPARFETGLLSGEGWGGRWIGRAGELRKEFTLGKKVKRARVHWSGLGYSELRLNGRKVGRSVLDPAWTTYDKRVLYASYDVTDRLRPGANALAVMLGQGWYHDRALLLQLNVEMEDGTTLSVVSDGTWKAAAGPIVADSIYDGETYDARLETEGWDRPGFDDGTWKAAEVVKGPTGVLSAQVLPPIEVVDTIVPQKVTLPSPGVYVFDMGQNFSGWARLRVRGPAGARVRMRFAELLYDDGRINQETLRAARAEDVYILKGEGDEEYEPRFTYHGFRYVEVTGYPGVPTPDSVRGRVVHSAVRQTGSFSCSNPLLNQLQHNIVWGQLTNLHSVPTDCCQRDERMGWMGDAQGTAEEALYNFDMAAFYVNFIRDIRDVQGADGTITDTVPHIWGSRPADPAWGTAYPLLVWYLYRYLGDTRTAAEEFDGLKKYVDFLRSKAENGLVGFSSYGDWVSTEPTPGALVSAFFYLYDVEIVRDLAKVLGKEEDTRKYGRWAAEIREKFRAKYYDPRTGNFGNGSQTSNVLGLFLETARNDERNGVFENLRTDVLYKHDTHLTTGIMGAKFILDVLTRFGAPDLAYDLAVQRTYPSWGYMIENGATTLWELWQNKTGPSMNSHNHPMFGSVGAWLYRTLAGIDMAPGSTGFENILIMPRPVRDLSYASGSIETLRGQVSVDWRRGDKSFRVEVVIPVNSRAEVVLPTFTLKNEVVHEGSNLVWSEKTYRSGVPGVTGARYEGPNVVLSIGSGRYVFELSGD